LRDWLASSRRANSTENGNCYPPLFVAEGIPAPRCIKPVRLDLSLVVRFPSIASLVEEGGAPELFSELDRVDGQGPLTARRLNSRETSRSGRVDLARRHLGIADLARRYRWI
jgi:hypothetical protein